MLYNPPLVCLLFCKKNCQTNKPSPSQTLLLERVEGWARWEKLDLLREHRAGRVRGHKVHGVLADSPAHPAHSRLKPRE